MTADDLLMGKTLLVDKPLDWSSFQVVNKIKFCIKKQFKLKKIKVGHAGTLDPKASGLLVVCTGKATKGIPIIQNAEKEYEAIIKIGAQTLSYDTEHPEINLKDFSMITNEEIEKTLAQFVGETEQKPPVFSAIKVQGARAYHLARKGREVQMKGRRITIISISKININLPYISFTVSCSKGTYIRSLAHDIGRALGTGAYLFALRRTRVGVYSVDAATDSYLTKDFRFTEF
ncbi:MAG: tRNA pseudouridine(55) synthase TruB [Bergeyella sp.]|nr:tRNA pseudouridine(55) synthase TruB [Bergeyella sp.]